MERAISTLRLMPETKEQQLRFAAQIVGHVADGMGDVLEVELFLRGVEAMIKEVRKDQGYRAILEDECNLYPEKTFRINSAQISKVSRTTFDYSNDPTWSELKGKIKARETLLKTVKHDSGVYDQELGQELLPPGKKTADSISVKFD